MQSIDTVWERLRELEGQEFKTITSLSFTYTITEDKLVTCRTKYNLTKKNFAKGLDLVPFEGPGVVNRKVRGPAYVWAILHDKRVRQSDW